MVSAWTKDCINSKSLAAERAGLGSVTWVTPWWKGAALGPSLVCQKASCGVTESQHKEKSAMRDEDAIEGLRSPPAVRQLRGMSCPDALVFLAGLIDNNNNNPSGVTHCLLVRHQRDAARRKAKNHHYYTLQRPFKAIGGADLRTSQAHAHRCLGAPTVSERKKEKDLRQSWRLTVSWCFPVRDPVPCRWYNRGLDWQCDGLLCREELHRKGLRRSVVVGPSG